LSAIYQFPVPLKIESLDLGIRPLAVLHREMLLDAPDPAVVAEKTFINRFSMQKRG